MKKQYVFILSFLILLCVAAGAFYFFVVSSVGAKKPYIEKPAYDELLLNSRLPVIENEHISYISNEIGAYRLHKDIRTGDLPEIEFVIRDTDIVFTLKVIESKPIVEKISATNPDIRISSDQDTMLKILSSDNVNEMIAKEAVNGKIGIVRISDEVTLGMKGYKAIYDSITKSQSGITGKSVNSLNPVKVTISTKLIILLSLLAIIEIVYLIEK